MAIFNAYSTGSPKGGGFTRGELWDACAGVCEEKVFNQRFDTFRALGMLLPAFPKPHEDRYILDPTSMALFLFLERISRQGGIAEVLTLLDSTRSAIRQGKASRADVHQNLLRARQMLIVYTDHLLSLLRTRPLRDLIAERERYDDPGLVDRMRVLHRLVVDRFQDLDRLAREVLECAQSYAAASLDFLRRLVDAGALSRDFSLLPPQQYKDAAKEKSLKDLAIVFSHAVVDPPDPGISPVALAEAVEELGPRVPRSGAKPPRPEPDEPQDDPLRNIAEKKRERRRRIREQAELILGAHDGVDLTEELRRQGWPGAAWLLVELLNASGPDEPHQIELADRLFVHPGEEVTYLSQVRLHRNPKGQPDTTEYRAPTRPDEEDDIP